MNQVEYAKWLFQVALQLSQERFTLAMCFWHGASMRGLADRLTLQAVNDSFEQYLAEQFEKA